MPPIILKTVVPDTNDQRLSLEVLDNPTPGERKPGIVVLGNGGCHHVVYRQP
jgi:hypothetical protein